MAADCQNKKSEAHQPRFFVEESVSLPTVAVTAAAATITATAAATTITVTAATAPVTATAATAKITTAAAVAAATVAAATAAAVATATTTATREVPAGTWAIFGDAHAHLTATNIGAVQGFDRLGRSFFRINLNESKSARSSCLAIHHNVYVCNWANLGKQLLELGLGQRVGKIPHKQLLIHLFSCVVSTWRDLPPQYPAPISTNERQRHEPTDEFPSQCAQLR